MESKSEETTTDIMTVGKVKIIQEASPGAKSSLNVCIDDPGSISDCPSNVSGLISPLNREVFSQLFDEATLDVMSSDGELTEIANRELLRIKQEPVNGNDLLKEAVTEAFRCSPTAPQLLKEERSSGVTSGQMGDWSGIYSFSMSLPDYTKPKDPQYSRNLNKLFIGQNKSVVIQMSVDSTKLLPTQLLSLKGEVVFTSPDHCDQVVGVCYQHSHNSAGQLRDPLAHHILRVSVAGLDTKYVEFTDSGRRAVVISPLPHTLPPGSSSLGVTVRFTDLGSCTGGINRRDTALVFTLEREGGVAVGRKVIPVRVCTCPKRDRENEESGVRALGVRSPAGGTKGVKRKVDGKEVYFVVAYGKDNFDALCKVGQVLEKNRPGGDVDSWAKDVAKVNRTEDQA